MPTGRWLPRGLGGVRRRPRGRARAPGPAPTGARWPLPRAFPAQGSCPPRSRRDFDGTHWPSSFWRLTSRCRWGPTAQPFLPERPTTWPRFTLSPAATATPLKCTYSTLRMVPTRTYTSSTTMTSVTSRFTDTGSNPARARRRTPPCVGDGPGPVCPSAREVVARVASRKSSSRPEGELSAVAGDPLAGHVVVEEVLGGRSDRRKAGATAARWRMTRSATARPGPRTSRSLLEAGRDIAAGHTLLAVCDLSTTATPLAVY
jgi:hypothetical protein